MKKYAFLQLALTTLLITPAPMSLWNDGGFSVFLPGAQAQIFYVSPTGNNGNTGTGPGDESAWQTIERVNTAVQNQEIGSGDEIRFHTGGTYRGGLFLNNLSGITVGTFPQGAQPAKLSGSVVVPNGLWNPDGNRYYADLPDAPDLVSRVYEGGQQMQVARYPNEDPVEPENSFRRNTSGVGATIVDADLPGISGYWNGAWAVVRSSNWQYQMREILSHTVTGSDVELVLKNDYPGDQIEPLDLDGEDWGYYIVNKLEELDSPGEWFYDPLVGRLYAISHIAGQPPLNVEIVVEEHGLYLQNCNTITIEDLAFSHYARSGVELFGPGTASFNITISNCVFSDLLIGIRDLYEIGLPTRTVNSCAFDRCLLYGVRATWAGGTLNDCRFTDIGLRSGYSGIAQLDDQGAVMGNEYGSYSAVQVQGDDIVIKDNVILRAGNNGINFSGTNAKAEQNHVSQALSLVNDGAAITFDNCSGCTVRHNIVSNSIGVLWGQATNSGNNEEKTTGIYFGNGSIVNTRVEGNTVFACGAGLLVDHAPGFEGNVVVGNTIFNSKYEQIRMQDLGEHGDDPYQQSFDTEVTNNIFYCLGPEQICLKESQVKATSFGGTGGLVDFGTYSDNHYFNAFSKVVVEQNVRFTVDGTAPITNYFRIDDRVISWGVNNWRDVASPNSDPAAVAHPLQLAPYKYDAVFVPEFVEEHSDDCTSAQAWSGAPAMLSGDGTDYLRFVDMDYVERWNNGEAGLTPIVENHPVSPPGTYRFTIRARSTNTDALQLAPVYDIDESNKYERPFKSFGLTPEWSIHEVVLEIPEGFHMVTAMQNVQRAYGAANSSVVDIDYVDVHRVQLDPTYADEIANNHILRYYCPIADASTENVGPYFTIPGEPGQCWSDVYGNFYAAGDTYELDEWASVVLFRFDSPTDLAMDVNGEYIVDTDETWTEHRNVAGSIVVPTGATLTIDGAHIGFAASTPQLTTNLTVQPGGTLVLKNGATLRNWMGCDGPAEMWDGVKALGTGTTTGAGLVVMESGARIADALTAIRCAEGQPNTIFGGNVGSGGIIQASNAVFENNFLDVVTRPHTVVDPAVWGPSSFTNCTFKRTRELHDTQLPPGGRVNLMSSASTPFLSCTFQNTTGDHSGMGIHAIDTRIKVEGAEEPATRSRFQGLDFAILHSAFSPTTLAVMDRCDFTDNKRGLLIAGADNSIVTRCTFAVADEVVTELGVEGAYGAYLFGCTGFEVEENTFSGTGTAHPKVGLVVRNTGIADNTFYNNTFSGFADASERSAGTIIMGANATTDFSTGLRIRCNDYDPEATNNFDVAFTGNAVSVAGEQGAPSPNAAAPAGNTFALVDPLTCDGNEARHLYEDVVGSLNAFSYWHHDPDSDPSVELEPHCSDGVPVDLQSTEWFYSKQNSCPVELSGMVPIGNDEDAAEDADNEHDVLVAVYDNWKDGGSTEGLIEFIQDPGNTSYAIRNELMLVAPKVSAVAWKACFLRDPAMNPWHLAQALLANSPLERGVLYMLDSSDIQPFYKELVLNGQYGGLSMHSIYKSEIAHFHSVKSGALQAMLRKSLASGDSTEMDRTLRALNEYPMVGKEQARFTLLLAQNDLVAARSLVDERLLNARQDKGLWDIYDLLLALREQNLSATELDAAGITALQNIAASEGVGAAQASAWLALLGTPMEEVVLLPNRNKRLKPRKEPNVTAHYPMLGAYPNPSNGPVYITYTVVEGVEQVELQMHDAQGRLVKRQRIGNSNGIVELQPRELSSGLHVASLYFDNILVGATKLNVVK